MIRYAVVFLAGLLFSIGLSVSGMTRPDRIVGFLDFTGDWDPSLLGVMGGAVAVTYVLYRLILKREAPVFSTKFALPTRKDIDARLVLGAALFGAGWGLGGFCPGPALVSTATGTGQVITFVGAMIAGMYLYEWLERVRALRRAVPVREERRSPDQAER